MPYNQQPHNLESIISNIKHSGYIPVLIHVERYTFLDTFEKYQALKELGIMFQFSINSLASNNHYDSDNDSNIQLLIKNGLIDFLSSDASNITHLDTLEKTMASEEYSNIFRKNTILNNYLLS